MFCGWAGNGAEELLCPGKLRFGPAHSRSQNTTGCGRRRVNTSVPAVNINSAMVVMPHSEMVGIDPGAAPRHAASHSSSVSKLFALPPHPP